jgi:hypothetical protein
MSGVVTSWRNKSSCIGCYKVDDTMAAPNEQAYRLL